MSKIEEPLPESPEELRKIINQQAAEIEQLKTKVNWFMGKRLLIDTFTRQASPAIIGK